MNRAPISAEVAADVARAVGDLGLDVVELRPLSRFGRAATYELELVDGARAKLRATLGDDAAASQAHRRAALRLEHPELRLSPVLGRTGRCLLEAWIDGVVVGDGPAGDELDEAAALLAALHGVEHLAGQPQHGGCRAGPILAEARERVAALHAEGLLDTRRAGSLGRLLGAVPDGVVPTALGHGDLCGANLVRAATGEVWSIDNEAVGPIAVPLDLAVAWYRWPVHAASFTHLLECYRHHAPDRRGLDDAVEHLRGWCAVAVAKGLWFRSRHQPDALPFAIDRLDTLLAWEVA